MKRVRKFTRAEEKNITLDELERRVNKLLSRATIHELAFKKKLDDAGIDYKFQWVVETTCSYFILDFLIVESGIVVEIDGESHKTKSGVYRDKARDGFLIKSGYKVFHIDNEDVDGFDVMELVLNPLKFSNKKPLKKKTKKRENKRIADECRFLDACRLLQKQQQFINYQIKRGSISNTLERPRIFEPVKTYRKIRVVDIKSN